MVPYNEINQLIETIYQNWTKNLPRKPFFNDLLKTLATFFRSNHLSITVQGDKILYIWEIIDHLFDSKIIHKREKLRDITPFHNFFNKNLTSNGTYWLTTGELFIPFKLKGGRLGALELKTEKKLDHKTVLSYETVAKVIKLVVSSFDIQSALHERLKELGCIYQIAHISDDMLSIDQILKEIAKILPPAMQYPDITVVKIVFDNYKIETSSFDITKKLTTKLVIKGRERGYIDVGYKNIEKKFLKEEQTLLDNVSKEISLLIEKKENELEQQKLEQQLLHADRLVTIGELSAGVAHELNEPLGNILGFSELIKLDSSISKDVENDIDKIIKASLHAREIIKKLLLFGRQKPPVKMDLDINLLIKDSFYFLESRCIKEGIKVIHNLSDKNPVLKADNSQIHQVLVNLQVNAIQAMKKNGGVLKISTDIEDTNLIITVEDSGCGIAPKDIDRVFLPFFTTKDVGEGTGLGLAVVHGIIKSHNGTIEIISKPDKGSKFIIILPLTPLNL